MEWATLVRGRRFGTWIKSAADSNPGRFTTARAECWNHTTRIRWKSFRRWISVWGCVCATKRFDRDFPGIGSGRFGYQIDIRLLDEAPHKALAMEIWLSIQTSRLDSHPQLEVKLKGERFKGLVENSWTSESCRLGILVHPLDQHDCHIMQENDGLAMRVFGRFMEKGVIRRMRFRLIAALEPESVAYWRDRFEEFSNSPLPLTT